MALVAAVELLVVALSVAALAARALGAACYQGMGPAEQRRWCGWHGTCKATKQPVDSGVVQALRAREGFQAL